VAVYYCLLAGEGAAVNRLGLSDLGEFRTWPDGFFEEEVSEALERTRVVYERARRRER
jgi:hypothetical protein